MYIYIYIKIYADKNKFIILIINYFNNNNDKELNKKVNINTCNWYGG